MNNDWINNKICKYCWRIANYQCLNSGYLVNLCENHISDCCFTMNKNKKLNEDCLECV